MTYKFPPNIYEALEDETHLAWDYFPSTIDTFDEAMRETYGDPSKMTKIVYWHPLALVYIEETYSEDENGFMTISIRSLGRAGMT